MEKTILVTVSDDRMGRKDGLYGRTQEKIKWMFYNQDDPKEPEKVFPNKDFGIDNQYHVKVEDLHRFTLNKENKSAALDGMGFFTNIYEDNQIFLDNIDAARNGRIYKPLVIKYYLDLLKEGDYLIYNDCSPEMWNLSNYVLNKNVFDIEVIKSLCITNNDFLTAFVKWDDKPLERGNLGRHQHRYFTTDLCLEQMGAIDYIDSYLIASGMICIRKTDDTVKLINEWLEYSKNPKCSCLGDPNIEDDFSYWLQESTEVFDTPGFKLGHRGDQSILSVLLNRRDANAVDIVYNDINPYNFVNFCRKDAEYVFINTNSKSIEKKTYIKVGDKVVNEKGIELNVYKVYLRENIWRYVIGKHEMSCYETVGSKLTKI